jgi:hypothetical protein
MSKIWLGSFLLGETETGKIAQVTDHSSVWSVAASRMKALFVGTFEGFASEPGRARIPRCIYRQGIGYATSKVGFVLAIAGFLLASQSPVCAMGAGAPDSDLLRQIGTYGAPLLAYVVLRLLTVNMVHRFMMRRTPEVARTEESAEEFAALTEVTRPLNGEDLRFYELDAAKGILLNDPYQERLERALKTGARTWRLYWQSFLAFAVSMLFIGIVCTVPKHFGAGAQPFASPELANIMMGSGQTGIVAAWFVAAFLLVAVLSLFSVGSRYRATGKVPLFSSIVGVFLLTIFGVFVGRVLALPFYLYSLPPFFSALVVFFGYEKIRRSARAAGNIKLLILRVFGSDRNTPLVFGPLMRRWQFLGSFFTIVDPSYIRHQFSLSSSETRWKLFRFFFFYGVFIAFFSLGMSFLLQAAATNPAIEALRSLNQIQRTELFGMVAWLILIPLAAFPVIAIVKNRFINSLAKLTRRIDASKQQDSGWSGDFKGFPMYCYDNVWKRAVNALLQVSDVVMMDLRGFSPARLGCEYEIGLLINQYPLQRTIFLVDRGDAKEGVYQLIRRRWAEMNPTSPNRNLPSQTVKVYAPDDENNKHDIPRILALLAASVDKETGGASAIVSFDCALPQRAAGLERVKSKVRRGRLVARIPELLDFAVATPKYGRIVVPLMLGAVLGLFFLRLWPVVSSFRAFSNQPVAVFADSPQDGPSKAAPYRPTSARLESADFKVEATAKVLSESGLLHGKQYSHPIEAQIDVTGGVASEAIRYGEVKIASTTDQSARSLEILSVHTTGWDDVRSSFEVIDRSAKNFFTKQPEHPQNGFRVKIQLLKPEWEITHVGNLSGTLTLQTIDTTQMVTIENIGSGLSGPGMQQIKHPKLDAIGEWWLMIHADDRERLHLLVDSKQSANFVVRVVDARGNVLPAQRSEITMGQTAHEDFAFLTNSVMNARLEIILGFRSKEVPFNLKNIVVQK